MKRLWLVPLALLAHLRADAARSGAAHRPRHLESIALARAELDYIACTKTAAKFLKAPVSSADAIEKAVDFCAVDARIIDHNYACAHFRQAIERALGLIPEDTMFDSTAFCQATEGYMLDIRGAARVPRTGTGSLLDFKISPMCSRAVAASFAPAEKLESASVPDFWWTMCMNQDCAHFLPSRTRWCHTQRQPTHSVMVCDAARTYALDEVRSHATGMMSPDEICAMYGNFVKAMGVDIDAYEHVMHKDMVNKVPVPDDKARTLLSAQLVNDAEVHYIRDHLSSPIE